MIPANLVGQAAERCGEGLVLALANDGDGAIMELRWCNRAFSKITGFGLSDILGQRGTILIGQNMSQRKHLLIIEKLMNWEQFSLQVSNNRKNGEPFWHEMSWTPLSDLETGTRWWLCTIVELPDQFEKLPIPMSPEPSVAEQRLVADYSEKIRKLEKENSHLQELAKSVIKESNEDVLTGISNRRHFEVELRSWIADLENGGPGFAIFYIDLDRFKSVNDTLGHDAGDRLLISVAGKLRDLVAETDLVSRIGGDEFVILKPLGDSALSISSLADNIVEKMRTPFEFEGLSASSSASVGVAIADSKMKTADQVVADADTALYHAKSQGRARWSFFTEEMHVELIENKRLATELLGACDRGEFVAYFQPLIDAATGQISSAEVLVRWDHPTKGILAPSVFLDTAASIGILRRIDGMMFEGLCKTLEDLDCAGVDLPRVAINTSADRLADPNFIHEIIKSGIDPKRLVVEVLESVSLDQVSGIVRWTLDELDELGVTIAIDDFGTGHASIQGLLQIKPAILKIDRQFIQPIVDDEVSRSLVRSIVGIGRSLNLSVVAEGVESEEHARLARDFGCDVLQGFCFGKPMPGGEFLERLIETGGKFWEPPCKSFIERRGSRP